MNETSQGDLRGLCYNGCMAARDPKTEALRNEIYRRMSGEQKIALAMKMREDAIAMTRDSIRRRRPELSADDLELEVRKRYLPPDLAELTEPLRREYVRRQRAEHERRQHD
jgi:hypothetical protein